MFFTVSCIVTALAMEDDVGVVVLETAVVTVVVIVVDVVVVVTAEVGEVVVEADFCWSIQLWKFAAVVTAAGAVI